jgi:hypothetical protein
MRDTHPEDFERIRDIATRMTDDEVWLLATLVVGIAGGRAQTRGADQVEGACAHFCSDMHRLVGTPALHKESTH